MKIGDITIAKGEHKLIQLPVAKLINGEYVLVEVEVFRAEEEGPTALFCAGMHGDEVTGVKIVMEALEQKLFENLKRGTVIAIPIINEIGFNQSTRTVSGKDINRCFPGNPKGSLASVIAHLLTTEILPHIDFGIDFHSGSVGIYNHPQLRINNLPGLPNLKLAKNSGASIIVKKNMIPKSFRKEAIDRGIDIFVFEGGEAKRLDKKSVEEGLSYIKRMLIDKEMLEGERKSITTPILKGSYWVRSTDAGIFIPKAKAGDDLGRKESVGTLDVGLSEPSVKLVTKEPGIVLGMRTLALTNKGDAVAHIASLLNVRKQEEDDEGK